MKHFLRGGGEDISILIVGTDISNEDSCFIKAILEVRGYLFNLEQIGFAKNKIVSPFLKLREEQMRRSYGEVQEI